MVVWAQVLWRAGDTTTEPREHLVNTAALAEYEEQLSAASGAGAMETAETDAAELPSRPLRRVVVSDDDESNSALPLARPLAEMLQSTRLEFRHLSADVSGALERAYKSNASQALSRVYALLFALAEARVSLLDDLTFTQRNSVLLELVENGPGAAGRELRAFDVPGCATAGNLRLPDEEALMTAGSVPIFEVSVDAQGKLVAGSHRISLHDRTMVHDMLGPSNILRVQLPEDDAISGAPQKGVAELVDTLAGGLVVCGKRFEFFGAKSDHKMSEIKVHFVAVTTPAVRARALYTREPVPRPWRTAGEARGLLAAFEALPTVEKLLKRLELMFSSTVRALEDVSFSVQHLSGALAVADCAGLQAGADGLANVYVCDDVVGVLPNGQPALDVDGEPRLMTDGAGLISLDLARRIPAVASGKLVSDADHDASSAPLVTQLRLWLEGMLAKGTLCACSTLPDGVIVLRRGSMIKVDVDAGGGEGPSAASVSTEPPPPHRSPSAILRAGFSRFEVCESSERPGKKARLNAQLIQILAEGARCAGGQPGWEVLTRHLTELQEAEVRRVRKLLTSSGPASLQTGPSQGTPHPTQTHAESRRVRAAALAELEAGSDASNALGVSASTMLLSGFDPVREPRLVELLRRLEETRLTKLTGSFKLPLVQAVNLFGQPDPTGSLPEGHVCVIVDGMELAHQMCSDGNGSGGCGAATEVLVHKSPGCHAGDVRKLKHMRTRELEALLRGVDPSRAHTIFFSTQGERAIADTIAGCDHDGDKFTVISDPLLVRLFAESPSWDAPPRGSKSATTPHTDPQALQV